MKKYLTSVILVITMLFTLNGGRKPKSKVDVLRDAASDLPLSTQKLVEEYIQQGIIFDMRVEYIEKMRGNK